MKATDTSPDQHLGDRPSFLDLLGIHDGMEERFLMHQEALLDHDVVLARLRLDEYARVLQEHIRSEEELLIPVYRRAGPVEGGRVEVFLGEHRKMLAFVCRFQATLDQLAEAQRAPTRAAMALLDEEATYRNLARHHDLRERRILYPALDRVTDEYERRALLRRRRIE